MTRVTFLYRRGRPCGFRASGHAGYADSGEDIVCAAISALTQTCELGLTEKLGLNVEVRRDDERGFYELTTPGIPGRRQRREAAILFDTLLIGLESIRSSYPEYLRINAKERRWN